MFSVHQRSVTNFSFYLQIGYNLIFYSRYLAFQISKINLYLTNKISLKLTHINRNCPCYTSIYIQLSINVQLILPDTIGVHLNKIRWWLPCLGRTHVQDYCGTLICASYTHSDDLSMESMSWRSGQYVELVWVLVHKNSKGYLFFK